MLEIQNFILLHDLLRLQIVIDNLTYYHYHIIDIIFLCIIIICHLNNCLKKKIYHTSLIDIFELHRELIFIY